MLFYVNTKPTKDKSCDEENGSTNRCRRSCLIYRYHELLWLFKVMTMGLLLSLSIRSRPEVDHDRRAVGVRTHLVTFFLAVRCRMYVLISTVHDKSSIHNMLSGSSAVVVAELR